MGEAGGTFGGLKRPGTPKLRLREKAHLRTASPSIKTPPAPRYEIGRKATFTYCICCLGVGGGGGAHFLGAGHGSAVRKATHATKKNKTTKEHQRVADWPMKKKKKASC